MDATCVSPLTGDGRPKPRRGRGGSRRGRAQEQGGGLSRRRGVASCMPVVARGRDVWEVEPPFPRSPCAAGDDEGAKTSSSSSEKKSSSKPSSSLTAGRKRATTTKTTTRRKASASSTRGATTTSANVIENLSEVRVKTRTKKNVGKHGRGAGSSSGEEEEVLLFERRSVFNPSGSHRMEIESKEFIKENGSGDV